MDTMILLVQKWIWNEIDWNYWI